jgi:hypothetical protein
MMDLRQNATFLSIAFKPTDDELQNATRQSHAPSRSNAALSQSYRSRRAPPKAEPDFIMELSDSDDELPDAAAILKNHSASQKNKGKQKAKGGPAKDDVCYWI